MQLICSAIILATRGRLGSFQRCIEKGVSTAWSSVLLPARWSGARCALTPLTGTQNTDSKTSHNVYNNT